MTRFCSCSGNLAVMLEISRKGKQLTKASCGTCGGRPLVDGIEPEPASMMLSTVDLELTNFINSDLTWKKVKKGCRSTNRRSRKLITPSFNIGVELGNMSRKRDQDYSVSESEKLGVAVLRRRFAEKVADVPIKKRRFLIQSPTKPPWTPSLDHEEFLSRQTQTLNPEESEQLVDSKLVAAGKWCSRDLHSNGKKRAFNKSEALKFTQSVDGVRNGKKSEVTNGICDYDDDFSGIQLLAAAACSSSVDAAAAAVNIKEKSVLEGFAKAEGIDSPSAAMPFKESIASSGTGNFSEKDLVNEDDMGDSFVEGSTISVSVNLNTIENGGVVKNRAHWDLNTVMEAWEEPSDDPLVNSKINNPKYVVNDGAQCEKFTLESCEMPRNLEDAECDTERAVQTVCKKVSSDLEGNQILVDPNSMVDAAASSCLQEDKLKACSSPKGTSIEKKYVTTATESLPEPLNEAVAMETSRDYCCPVSHHTASSHVFEGKMNTSASDLDQMGEDSSGTSVAENIKSLSGSSQAGKLDIFSPDMPQLNKSASEIDGTQPKDSEDFEKAHGLPGCRTSPRQVSTLTCKTLDVGNSVGESDKADCFHPSPKGEALSASSTSVAVGEVKRQVDTSSATDNTVNDFALQIGPMELMGKSTNSLSKLGPENNFSDCHGSYATQDGHMAGQHMTEYDPGYDSSFEDGELREPGVYSWEENEVEGETERVDYGSDYGVGDDFDAVDYSLSENLETGRDGYQIPMKEVSLAKNDDIEKIGVVGNKSAVDGESVKFLQQCFKGDHLKERSSSLSLKEKNPGAYQFNEHLEYGNAEGNVDGHADKGLLAGEFGSRTSRENLLSYSKGFDALERKSMHPAHRGRYENSHYSYMRAERDFGVEKFVGRDKFSFKACGRNETDGHWVDSAAGYWETRNRYPHSYRGTEGHGYSHPRDVIANSGAKVSEMKSHGDRRSINYSSNGTYRPIMRRRPPADRDDSYGVQRGISPVRGIGRNGSRGRSGPYAQGIRRGPKEYPEDVLDAAAADVPPVHRQQYFVRRERAFSPNYRPCRNSCSRSRTRSPVAWRDRNVGTRRRCTDLRSDTKMERMRSPFQKPSFAADNEEIFMSPPRGRLSPQSNSRWFDNGNYMDNHFRDRRSPVRIFRRSQRFDSVGYSGRLKSDGFFRPMSHRGRFHQASGSGRGRDFEGSDDEKRKHNGYEMSHRIRRYDAGGAVRRFRYDTEDCFEPRNSQNDDVCFRGAIKRDIPRSGAREDRGRRYKNDRTYASASSSGQRDFNDNAAVREEGPHDL